MKKTKDLTAGLKPSMVWTAPFLGFTKHLVGKEAFERRDCPVALMEFKDLAEENDPRGQYGLSVLFDIG